MAQMMRQAAERTGDVVGDGTSRPNGLPARTSPLSVALPIQNAIWVIAMGVVDNLGKGAAGRAVQNANLICGLPETVGLESAPVWP